MCKFVELQGKQNLISPYDNRKFSDKTLDLTNENRIETIL